MRFTFYLFYVACEQVDVNQDRLVSLDEFMAATNKKEFLEQDGWEVYLYNPCYLQRIKFN